MGKLLRLQRNKFFVTFLIALVLVFSYEHNKPKAFIPLAWLGAVAVGMVAEEMITMGIKAGSKAVLRNKADDYAADAVKKGGFDWQDLNPYRNKDGSISLSPSANDRAKMAGLIGGALAGSMYEGGSSDIRTITPVEGLKINIIPSTADHWNLISTAYINKMHRVEYEMLNGQHRVRLFSNVTGYRLKEVFFQYAGEYDWQVAGPLDFPYPDVAVPYYSVGGAGEYLTVNGVYKRNISNFETDYDTLAAFWNIQDVEEAAGAEIIYNGDVYYPSTVNNIYNAPFNMGDNVAMPNAEVLDGYQYNIGSVYPAGEEEGFVTWEDLDRHLVENGVNLQDLIDAQVDLTLDRGDINNEYTIEEVNNIFTDVNNPVKVDDFVPEVGTGEELPVVPSEGIDKSLLVIAKESYQFLADTVKTSINGLTTVTAGAAGLIAFLGDTMGWLPEEWRIMYAAAFGLGLFAFFFRR